MANQVHGQAYIRAVGRRIREQRISSGLQQRDLANRLGMALQGPLSDIERGKHLPSVATLMKICRELGCTPNDILIGDPT